jgi:hypothetical protein
VRRLFLPLTILAVWPCILRAGDAPRRATADEAVLFQEAVQNSKQDTEHWAYTETTVIKAGKGGPNGETVVRFDPSKPYAEQFTPLKVEGQPPTERQLKKYRERGERRGERVARAAAATTTPGSAPPALHIGGTRVSMDVQHPQVVEAGETQVIFEVPLLGASNDIPVDKFEVRVVVGRASRQAEHVVLRIRESFRVKLVAKVKAGEVHMDFTVVDPKFGPVPTAMSGDIAASLLFIPVSAEFNNTRTDWKRVKSYNERLQVKLGPLEVLDF